MLRALLYLIAMVVAISVLRSIIGFLASLFTNVTVGPKRPTAASREPSKPEALQRDPVCGTFVAPSAAISMQKDGEMLYFCSTACRDKFR